MNCSLQRSRQSGEVLFGEVSLPHASQQLGAGAHDDGAGAGAQAGGGHDLGHPVVHDQDRVGRVGVEQALDVTSGDGHGQSCTARA